MPAPRETGVPTNILQSLSIRYNSATPAVAGQMVGFDGLLIANTTTPCFGVLREDAAQGQTVSVATQGLVECLSGGAIAIGAAIGSDGVGKAISVTVNNQIIGRAVSATTAPNQKFQMLITREGTY